MATATMLGPADHGKLLSLEEFETSPVEEGYRYEIIDGRLYVSPLPNLPHELILIWIHEVLLAYSRAHPEVINLISTKARIFLPDSFQPTRPEPDLAVYQDFPRGQKLGAVNWRDVNPILVVEVVSEDDPDKDLVRNVELYLRVLSIKEYWIYDTREEANPPSLLVYRRRGSNWQRPITVSYGEIYTTRMLPGLNLVIQPTT